MREESRISWSGALIRCLSHHFFGKRIYNVSATVKQTGKAREKSPDRQAVVCIHYQPGAEKKWKEAEIPVL